MKARLEGGRIVTGRELELRSFRERLYAQVFCGCGGVKEPCRACGAPRCYAPGHLCAGCGEKSPLPEWARAK